MCKSLKQFTLILTALSVILNLTVSPVLGAQYSDAGNASYLNTDHAMWEEGAAERLSDTLPIFLSLSLRSRQPLK